MAQKSLWSTAADVNSAAHRLNRQRQPMPKEFQKNIILSLEAVFDRRCVEIANTGGQRPPLNESRLLKNDRSLTVLDHDQRTIKIDGETAHPLHNPPVDESSEALCI
jgi:hypothetical protein